MKAKIITLKGHSGSELNAATCIKSSKKLHNTFDIETFDAITPEQVPHIMNSNMIQWTYPLEGVRDDFGTGLKLTAYPTEVPEKRIACFLSHWTLWKEVIETNEPMLILEHDAKFVRHLDPQYIIDSKFSIVGINDPIGATRKARTYKDMIQRETDSIIPVPRIDEFNIPQGLAGNSAYILKPNGAKQLIETMKDTGIWPNDALMCYQLIKLLGVTTQFYTTIQPMESTTTK